MTITIEKTKQYTKSFVRYIVRVLRRNILSKLNLKTLYRYDKYFKSLGIKTTSREVVLYAIKNISYREFEDKYIVYIKERDSLFRDKYSMYNLCKLLDQGTLDLKPLRLFSDPMKEIEKNIKKYFNMYCFMPL